MSDARNASNGIIGIVGCVTPAHFAVGAGYQDHVIAHERYLSLDMSTTLIAAMTVFLRIGPNSQELARDEIAPEAFERKYRLKAKEVEVTCPSPGSNFENHQIENCYANT